MAKVLSGLGSRDQAAFRRVCKSWNNAHSDNMVRFGALPPTVCRLCRHFQYLTIAASVNGKPTTGPSVEWILVVDSLPLSTLIDPETCLQ
jgi:hypothetical protein